MTRATAKPVKRVVTSMDGEEYVVEVAVRMLTMRPIRTKRGGPVEIEIPWGAVYLRAMMEKCDRERRAKKLTRSRR